MASIGKARDFESQAAAEELRGAMEGMGTDEDRIGAVLGSHSNKQIQEISTQYTALYGRDLIEDIRKEAHGHFEDCAIGLVRERTEFLAQLVRDALKGAGTSEEVLVDVFGTIRPKEVEKLKEKYKELFEEELQEAISSDLGGYFERFMISILSGGRSESKKVDEDMAREDAKKIYEAGEGKIGTDETAFMSVFMTRSWKQLRKMVEMYDCILEENGEGDKDIVKSICKEFSSSEEKLLTTVVKYAKDPVSYFAELLEDCMCGIGTSEYRLWYTIVRRCEIDLAKIREEYERKFETTLRKRIEDDLGDSDHLGILLIKLVEGNDPIEFENEECDDEESDEEEDFEDFGEDDEDEDDEEVDEDERKRRRRRNRRRRRHQDSDVEEEFDEQEYGEEDEDEDDDEADEEERRHRRRRNRRRRRRHQDSDEEEDFDEYGEDDEDEDDDEADEEERRHRRRRNRRRRRRHQDSDEEEDFDEYGEDDEDEDDDEADEEERRHRRRRNRRRRQRRQDSDEEEDFDEYGEDDEDEDDEEAEEEERRRRRRRNRRRRRHRLDRLHDQVVFLRNKCSEHVIDGGPETQLCQWERNEEPHQMFRLVHVEDDIFHIVSVKDGKVLDVEWGANENGASICKYDLHGGVNQQWRFKPAGDGSNSWFIVSAMEGGRAIDVPDCSPEMGVLLHLWEHNGGDNQIFYTEFA